MFPLSKRAASPKVRIEMIDLPHSVPVSPVLPPDQNFLFPPSRTFTSRSSADRPSSSRPRPASAPPTLTKFVVSRGDKQVSLTPVSHSFRQSRSSSSFSPTNALGGLARPPPPLFRPKTFWRNTPRSGVTNASYSPSSHLIRRSTFVAAGLPLDHPVADLSALCVESRVRVVFLPPETGI
ncbi:hypothetical protein OBBRIDRAFT_456269 [Obba rivulosa]|uniref:Uncharacterized protein n=1 Tax=Obba rivulosa TaxID=1052685 RepID=A0A8E2DP03_9APHY|nr:hypothetical protein OBBRIDRAFT_456269 [Obba rivulosa]